VFPFHSLPTGQAISIFISISSPFPIPFALHLHLASSRYICLSNSAQSVLLISPYTGAYSPVSSLCLPAVRHFRKTVLPRRQIGPVSTWHRIIDPPAADCEALPIRTGTQGFFHQQLLNVTITVVASTQISFNFSPAIVTVLIALQFTDPTLICDGTVPAQSLLHDLTSSRNVSVHFNEV
jgi:hypothetical protein